MSKGPTWSPEFTFATAPAFPSQFPHLRPDLCTGDVSPATTSYNCIAWAATDTTAWWEPDLLGQYYWPEGVERAYTREAYVSAFCSVGFEVCTDGVPELGAEKIVIYVRNGVPTHAARQLPDGCWTSKLGLCEDIEHMNLECLNGPCYGEAAIYLKRPIA